MRLMNNPVEIGIIKRLYDDSHTRLTWKQENAYENLGGISVQALRCAVVNIERLGGGKDILVTANALYV